MLDVHLALADFRNRRFQEEPYPRLAEAPGHHPLQRRPHVGKGLGDQVHQGHFDAVLDEQIGRLAPDQAGPQNYDGPLGPDLAQQHVVGHVDVDVLLALDRDAARVGPRSDDHAVVGVQRHVLDGRVLEHGNSEILHLVLEVTDQVEKLVLVRCRSGQVQFPADTITLLDHRDVVSPEFQDACRLQARGAGPDDQDVLWRLRPFQRFAAELRVDRAFGDVALEAHVEAVAADDATADCIVTPGLRLVRPLRVGQQRPGGRDHVELPGFDEFSSQLRTGDAEGAGHRDVHFLLDLRGQRHEMTVRHAGADLVHGRIVPTRRDIEHVHAPLGELHSDATFVVGVESPRHVVGR